MIKVLQIPLSRGGSREGSWAARAAVENRVKRKKRRFINYLIKKYYNQAG
jgi:hypothetical protein